MGRQAATKKAAAPAADPEPEAPSTYTISNVERILQEVQMPAAPIRSSVVAMLKAQRAMGDEFVPRFCLQVNRILCVKKKEPAIEKVIKFMTAYCRHLSEKGAHAACPPPFAKDCCIGTVEEQDFTEGLLMYLMRGVAVKDKAVRFRCTQMVALIMNELTEITYGIVTVLVCRVNCALFSSNFGLSIAVLLLFCGHFHAHLTFFPPSVTISGKNSSALSSSACAIATRPSAPRPSAPSPKCRTTTRASWKVLSSSSATIPAGTLFVFAPIFLFFFALFSVLNCADSDVRKCVLANIQLCDVTLDAVVERRRDTDARVRRFLFKYVAKNDAHL